MTASKEYSEMAANAASPEGGLGLGSLLLVLFIALKLCGVIAWSWWWVMAPLWIPALIVVLVFGIMFLVFLVFLAGEYIR